MADQHLDDVVAIARTELRQALDATPPSIERMAQRTRARRRALLGVLGAIVTVALAVPYALGDRDTASNLVAGPSSEGPNAILLRPGESRPLARSPLAGRSTMAAVWTGHEMLVWGGEGSDGQFADGASYDPRSDTWTVLPASPLTARNAPAAVWTGQELLLWGGSSSAGSFRDGAAYNPATRRWRSLADSPIASAGLPVGVWTGSEMIVLAGLNSREAAAYDPASDRWRALPELPGQLQAPNPVGVWADNEVFTVVSSGGVSPNGTPRLVSLRSDGVAWSNVRDLQSGQTVLAWTGDALVVASGTESFKLRSGGSEETIAAAPSGFAIGDKPAAWTGAELLFWEGDTASAIDPAAGTWQSIPSGDSSRRIQPAVVWADGVLVAWGGFPDHASGVMLRPPGSASSGGSSGQSTTSSIAAPRSFDVSGVMQMAGGPRDAAPSAAPGTIEARDRNGGVVGRSETAPNGTFTLQLPPGSYRLVGRSGLYQSGAVDCTADVTVTDGRVGDVVVQCVRR